MMLRAAQPLSHSALGLVVLASLVSGTSSFVTGSYGLRGQGSGNEGLRACGQLHPSVLVGAQRGRRLRTSALGLRAQEEEGLREGTEADAELISKMIKAEKMNPLFLDPKNFVVAEMDGDLVGFGQIRKTNNYYELASLVVVEEARGQGVGTAIVTELLERHKARFSKDNDVPSVLLLTLKGTTKFYAQMGFLEFPISMAPLPLQMEAGVGGIVGKMVTGQKLVAMKYKFTSSVELSCEKSGTILKKVTKDK